MALSAFDDKAHPPGEKDLGSVLGTAFDAWTQLISLVTSTVQPIDEVWGFSSASAGWSLRLQRKGRVILYMTPRDGCFLVSLALGEKAVAAAREARLPASLLKVIDAAPRYAEGRGVRLEVRQKRQVAALARIALIKMEH